MKVNYGPPGHKGVTQIMGLGADALPGKVSEMLPGKAHRQVAGAAAGAWFLGLLMGSSRIQNIAIGGGLAIVACAHLMKQEDLPNIEPLPTTVQGWG